MDLKNFLPMFSLPFSTYIKGTIQGALVTFGNDLVYLVIIPFVRETKLIKKSLFSGVFISLILLLIIVIRDIAALGNFADVFSLPTYESLRLISVGEAFNRMEIIFAILRLIIMFFRVAILYYGTVLCIAQFCKLKTYKPIVFVIGAIITSYSIIVFKSPVEAAVWGKEIVHNIYFIYFQWLLPLITFITIMIKKKTKIRMKQ